jgi:nicotinate-nucleotide pyrophosphorylase (carboxylating)
MATDVCSGRLKYCIFRCRSVYLCILPLNGTVLTTQEFIEAALREDIGAGDHSTLASIEPHAQGKATLKIKENGIIAGMDLAQNIFHFLEPGASFTWHKKDGDIVENGETAFEVEARIHTILQAERLALNCMQRMSGIATLTSQFVDKIKGYPARILDTRKTTPLFRAHEKAAVLIGGGYNHRMGLHDMIMLKDNHIDFCGGIEKAIRKTKDYLKTNGLSLKIEVETRRSHHAGQLRSGGAGKSGGDDRRQFRDRSIRGD